MASAPERADARANRQRILDAALEVIAEKGAATEIKEVAERAGVGVGTIYRNFATKDDLLRGILDNVIEKIEGIQQRSLAAEDPEEGIRLFIAEMYEVMERWSPAVMAMLSGAFTEQLKARFMGYLQDRSLEEIFRRGIATGQFRKDLPVSLARGLLATMCDPMVYLSLAGQLKTEEMTAGMTDLLLRAIRTGSG